MAIPPSKTYLIVGASRGIGLELTTQLLSSPSNHTVIATARAPLTFPPSSVPGTASKLWSLTGTLNGHNLTILECDVSNEESIKAFTESVRRLGRKGGILEAGVIDVVILNAGVLEYPNRISEVTFKAFEHHLKTNTIGPLITASSLLSLSSPLPHSTQPPQPTPSYLTTTHTTHPILPPSPISPAHPFSPIPIHIHTLLFISSDSGSTSRFLSYEDGFGAYSVSKAALNQGLRHLALELNRKAKLDKPARKAPVVLAIHPGEVATDMAANVNLEWDVEGIISVRESVRGVLEVVEEKGWGGVDEGGRGGERGERGERGDGDASFWTWEGRRYPW